MSKRSTPTSLPSSDKFVRELPPVDVPTVTEDRCEIVRTARTFVIIRHDVLVFGHTHFRFYEKARANHRKDGTVNVGKPIAYTYASQPNKIPVPLSVTVYENRLAILTREHEVAKDLVRIRNENGHEVRPHESAKVTSTLKALEDFIASGK